MRHSALFLGVLAVTLLFGLRIYGTLGWGVATQFSFLLQDSSILLICFLLYLLRKKFRFASVPLSLLIFILLFTTFTYALIGLSMPPKFLDYIMPWYSRIKFLYRMGLFSSPIARFILLPSLIMSVALMWSCSRVSVTICESARGKKLIIFFATVLLLCPLVTTRVSYYYGNPIVYSYELMWDRIINWQEHQALVAASDRLNSEKSPGLRTFSKARLPKINPEGRDVLVFVMEGLIRKRFDEATKEATSLYSIYKNNIIEYNNYYATNADSVTSILSLLSGAFYPFRAYSADINYSSIKVPNLLDVFKDNGYKTVFSLSKLYGNLISHLDWDEKIGISEEEYGASDLKCASPVFFDKGCEDLILIPKIYDLLNRESKPVFFLHEFLVGHSKAMRLRENAFAYYEEFILKILSHNKYKNNMPYVVIVSDHGSRQNLTDFENFRLPLIIINPKRATYQKVDNELFFNHTDFPRIFSSELSKGSLGTQGTEQTYFMGGSGDEYFGLINSKGVFVYNNTRWKRTVSPENNLSTTDLRDQYINLFNFLKTSRELMLEKAEEQGI